MSHGKRQDDVDQNSFTERTMDPLGGILWASSHQPTTNVGISLRLSSSNAWSEWECRLQDPSLVVQFTQDQYQQQQQQQQHIADEGQGAAVNDNDDDDDVCGWSLSVQRFWTTQQRQLSCVPWNLQIVSSKASMSDTKILGGHVEKNQDQANCDAYARDNDHVQTQKRNESALIQSMDLGAIRANCLLETCNIGRTCYPSFAMNDANPNDGGNLYYLILRDRQNTQFADLCWKRGRRTWAAFVNRHVHQELKLKLVAADKDSQEEENIVPLDGWILVHGSTDITQAPLGFLQAFQDAATSAARYYFEGLNIQPNHRFLNWSMASLAVQCIHYGIRSVPLLFSSETKSNMPVSIQDLQSIMHWFHRVLEVDPQHELAKEWVSHLEHQIQLQQQHSSKKTLSRTEQPIQRTMENILLEREMSQSDNLPSPSSAANHHQGGSTMLGDENAVTSRPDEESRLQKDQTRRDGKKKSIRSKQKENHKDRERRHRHSTRKRSRNKTNHHRSKSSRSKPRSDESTIRDRHVKRKRNRSSNDRALSSPVSKTASSDLSSSSSNSKNKNTRFNCKSLSKSESSDVSSLSNGSSGRRSCRSNDRSRMDRHRQRRSSHRQELKRSSFRRHEKVENGSSSKSKEHDNNFQNGKSETRTASSWKGSDYERASSNLGQRRKRNKAGAIDFEEQHRDQQKKRGKLNEHIATGIDGQLHPAHNNGNDRLVDSTRSADSSSELGSGGTVDSLIVDQWRRHGKESGTTDRSRRQYKKLS